MNNKYIDPKILKKYYYSFEIPYEMELWDIIVLDYMPSYEDTQENLKAYTTAAKGFNQQNKHHTQDLGEHMNFVGNTLVNLTNNRLLIQAGYVHDIGKLSTQTKAEDGNCHYYNHGLNTW